MGCKKTNVFLHPIVRGLEKMRRMDKLSADKVLFAGGYPKPYKNTASGEVCS